MNEQITILEFSAYVIILLAAFCICIYLLKYFHPPGLPSFFDRRRVKKFIEIGGQCFHTEIISEFFHFNGALRCTRADVDKILGRFSQKIKLGLDCGGVRHCIFDHLIEPAQGKHDLLRYQEAAVFYCLFDPKSPGFHERAITRGKFFRVLNILDVVGNKRINLAVGYDLLPVENFTTEFPLHNQGVAPGQHGVDQGRDGGPDERADEGQKTHNSGTLL